MAAPATDPDVAWFARFLPPDKLLGLRDVPGAPEPTPALVAPLFGLGLDAYERLLRDFRTNVDVAARALLAVPELELAAARLAALGGPVVALGDSLTADLQSWAEILGRAVALVAPGSPVRVVNGGVGGDTTADALRRLPALCDQRPSAVVTLIGTNDACRRGHGAMVAVSDAETERNLALIDRQVRRAGSAHVWVTPPPVLESRVAQHRFMSRWRVAYRDEDIAAKAALIRAAGVRVVDVHAGLAAGPLAERLLDDGVHLSAAGQRDVAARVLAELSR